MTLIERVILTLYRDGKSPWWTRPELRSEMADVPYGSIKVYTRRLQRQGFVERRENPHCDLRVPVQCRSGGPKSATWQWRLNKWGVAEAEWIAERERILS